MIFSILFLKKKILKSYKLSPWMEDLRGFIRAFLDIGSLACCLEPGHTCWHLWKEIGSVSRHGALDRHSDTPENPFVAAFYVDGIMKCLRSDSRFGANVRFQVRVMLQPIFRMSVFQGRQTVALFPPLSSCYFLQVLEIKLICLNCAPLLLCDCRPSLARCWLSCEIGHVQSLVTSASLNRL